MEKALNTFSPEKGTLSPFNGHLHRRGETGGRGHRRSAVTVISVGNGPALDSLGVRTPPASLRFSAVSVCSQRLYIARCRDITIPQLTKSAVVVEKKKKELIFAVRRKVSSSLRLTLAVPSHAPCLSPLHPESHSARHLCVGQKHFDAWALCSDADRAPQSPAEKHSFAA